MQKWFQHIKIYCNKAKSCFNDGAWNLDNTVTGDMVGNRKRNGLAQESDAILHKYLISLLGQSISLFMHDVEKTR